ncbi:MAG: hypothetical protein ACO21J_00900 [Anaerohalosphaeraceae bacterium]|jgi:hypothetical protein
MDLTPLLATVTEQASGTSPLFDVGEAKLSLYELISDLHWLYAMLLLSVGVVYLLYGWRIFRALVVISFGFIGMFLGMLSADKLSSNDHALMWGGIIGMALFASIAVPLMKWCVSVLGAVAGGILTSGIWIAFDLSDTYLPAGFIVGFIAGGLISFIMLKVSVMLFTSLGGSLITVTGLLALLYQYDVKVSDPMTFYTYNLILTHPWFLPLAIIIPTIAGMLVQNKLIKQSPQWEI